MTEVVLNAAALEQQWSMYLIPWWRANMAKKSSVLSQPVKLRRLKNEDITFDERAKAELAAIEERPIDLTDPDVPEVTDWSTAQRGKFYRPIKQQITIPDRS